MPRVKREGEGWYHIVSRTAFQLFKFTEKDRSVFVSMMGRVAAFSGVEVLNYCMMSNHFHILLHVPEPVELTEKVLLERYAALYGRDDAKALREGWKALRKAKQIDRLEREQEMLKRRMGDISQFMKTLKQRFSMWYRHEHASFSGTLWEGRFKSVILQGNPATLSAVSAYIDLNPVRARMVGDPAEYRWSGYGAAVAGSATAMRGLARVFRADATEKDFVEVAEKYYRAILYQTGSDAMTPEKVEEVLRRNGKFTIPQLVRLKVRYFISGMCVGDAEFVEGVFAENRAHFGKNRINGARAISRCGKWQGVQLCTARKLVKAPIETSV